LPTVNRPVRRSALGILDLYRSAVGKKWVMAITGIVLMLFVLGHMVGNLKMYLGPAEFNHYAEFLRELLVPILPHEVGLWIVRIGLIAAFVVHLHAAYSLTMMNRRARTQSYDERSYIAATFAARTMRMTGIVVLLFIIWHLADLTFGWANPDFVSGEVYDNVVASFSRVWVAAVYVVANLALGVHLFHGSWSIFQSLGTMSPSYNPLRNPVRRGIAVAFTVVVVGANISFPLAVQFGIVG
jgi:succinate dehydrogenase / fumarate reductase cytochrome b subunit